MLPDWHAHGVLFLFIAVPRPEGTDGHLRPFSLVAPVRKTMSARMSKGASIISKLRKTFILTGKLGNLLPRALA